MRRVQKKPVYSRHRLHRWDLVPGQVTYKQCRSQRWACGILLFSLYNKAALVYEVPVPSHLSCNTSGLALSSLFSPLENKKFPWDFSKVDNSHELKCHLLREARHPGFQTLNGIAFLHPSLSFRRLTSPSRGNIPPKPDLSYPLYHISISVVSRKTSYKTQLHMLFSYAWCFCRFLFTFQTMHFILVLPALGIIFLFTLFLPSGHQEATLGFSS